MSRDERLGLGKELKGRHWYTCAESSSTPHTPSLLVGFPPPYGISQEECGTPNLWTTCRPTPQSLHPAEESAAWAGM